MVMSELALKVRGFLGDGAANGTAVTQVDPDTYAPVDQRRWLAGTAAITACQRQDGRWRYLQLPLTLQVLPAAPDDL